jgi:hypothetical protein
MPAIKGGRLRLRCGVAQAFGRAKPRQKAGAQYAGDNMRYVSTTDRCVFTSRPPNGDCGEGCPAQSTTSAGGARSCRAASRHMVARTRVVFESDMCA